MHHDVPISTAHLIPEIDELLITLLKSLQPEDYGMIYTLENTLLHFISQIGCAPNYSL